MDFVFEQRPADVPLVDLLWRTQAAGARAFISRAVIHWEMVVMRHQGRVTLTVRGPETKATIAPIPADAEFFGIRFALGTVLPLSLIHI